MNTASEKQVRLLIDMNSIVNQAMLGGTDHENGIVLTHPETGKDVKINSAMYTVDRFLERRNWPMITQVVADAIGQPILVNPNLAMSAKVL